MQVFSSADVPSEMDFVPKSHTMKAWKEALTSRHLIQYKMKPISPVTLLYNATQQLSPRPVCKRVFNTLLRVHIVGGGRGLF